jgi:hypothetical protein
VWGVPGTRRRVLRVPESGSSPETTTREIIVIEPALAGSIN